MQAGTCPQKWKQKFYKIWKIEDFKKPNLGHWSIEPTEVCSDWKQLSGQEPSGRDLSHFMRFLWVRDTTNLIQDLLHASQAHHCTMAPLLNSFTEESTKTNQVIPGRLNAGKEANVFTQTIYFLYFCCTSSLVVRRDNLLAEHRFRLTDYCIMYEKLHIQRLNIC